MKNYTQGYKIKENETIEDKWELIQKIDSNLPHELQYKNHIGKNDNVLDFSQHCHLYAQYLLSKERIGEYKSFINNFNKIVSTDYDYHYMKELSTKFMSTGDDVFIKDCIIKINKSEFVDEKTFSDIVKYDLQTVHGIEVIQEKSINLGRADILIDNNLIELKTSKLKYKDVFQVVQYVIENDFDSYTLVGSGIQHEGIFDIADKYGISIMKYDFIYEVGYESVPIGMVIAPLNNNHNNGSNMIQDAYNDQNNMIMFSYKQDAINLYELALNKINSKISDIDKLFKDG